MSTTITAAIQILSSTTLTTGFGQLNPSIGVTKSFTHGTGNNQADQTYFADLLVASSGTPKDLDLIGGGLTQPDGAAFAPVEINRMTITNNHATATLTVGGGSNPWVSWLGGTTPTVKIPPGGTICMIAPNDGWAVTAGSADGLRISTDSGTNVPVTIELLGRSA